MRICIALKISIALAGFEVATLGSSGKHTNHYTTEATWVGGPRADLDNEAKRKITCPCWNRTPVVQSAVRH
jgi:hypothetical protein